MLLLSVLHCFNVFICIPLFYLHFNCFVVRSLLLFECTASIQIIIGLQHILLQVASKLQLIAHRVIIYIVILSPEICWLQVYRCSQLWHASYYCAPLWGSTLDQTTAHANQS